MIPMVGVDLLDNNGLRLPFRNPVSTITIQYISASNKPTRIRQKPSSNKAIRWLQLIQIGYFVGDPGMP